MAVIALVLAILFAVVGVAAFLFGEPFLGVMGLIGMLMVLWAGGLTLFRGSDPLPAHASEMPQNRFRPTAVD